MTLKKHLIFGIIRLPHQTYQNRRGANLMINQMNQNENTQNEFSYAIKELKLGKLLRQSNITKSCGVPAFEVFQFLLFLVF